MPKSQPIKKKETKKQVVVVNEKRQAAPAVPEADLSVANKPVRCVNFVEVGDMEPQQMQVFLRELSVMHESNRGGIHYIVPVRNGKIPSNILFEDEFLKVVNQMCEVTEDGEIQLKGGSEEVEVIRRDL